ncbi:MAG: porin family protein [Acidobacteria bacterium]|nr:porin family protein [Candidatus Sulfomarinibacter sp. MAG AM1]
MKKVIQALVLTTVLLAPTAAMAGEFEITPFLGYQFGGDVTTFYQGEYHDVNINSSENWGLVLSLGLSPMTQIELLYSTQDTEADADRFEDSLGLRIDYWQVSMLWNFDPDSQIQPYVVFGIGGTWLRPDGFSSLSRFSGNIGGGAKIFFSDNVGLLLEGRFYGTYINSTTSYCDPFWCYGYNNSLYQFDVSAGLIIRFGD